MQNYDNILPHIFFCHGDFRSFYFRFINCLLQKWERDQFLFFWIDIISFFKGQFLQSFVNEKSQISKSVHIIWVLSIGSKNPCSCVVWFTFATVSVLRFVHWPDFHSKSSHHVSSFYKSFFLWVYVTSDKNYQFVASHNMCWRIDHYIYCKLLLWVTFSIKGEK